MQSATRMVREIAQKRGEIMTMCSRIFRYLDELAKLLLVVCLVLPAIQEVSPVSAE